MRHIVRAGILCVLAAGIAGALPSEARAAAEWTTAPVSARFLNAAAQGRTATAGGRLTGYRPGPIDFASADIARAGLEGRRAGRTALPLWYDLRTTGHVTPVRDQAPYGTCWAFAALGSLESTILKAGGASPEGSVPWRAIERWMTSRIASCLSLRLRRRRVCLHRGSRPIRRAFIGTAATGNQTKTHRNHDQYRQYHSPHFHGASSSRIYKFSPSL